MILRCCRRIRSKMYKLIESRYKNRVFYIEGKLREDYTMLRCKMHEAVAVFILPNKNAMNKPEEDTESVLTLFYIKKYLASRI
jgi:hypothetical protein